MSLFRRMTAGLISVAALLAVPLAAPAATASPTTSGAGYFVVHGRVNQPMVLTLAELRADFAEQRVFVSFISGEDKERHRYKGALLIDVLNAAQPAFDPERKNDALRHSVLVTATDGYQATVAWGEIDPGFEGKEVLLAYEEDGQPLDRPRLVVPGDERGGRYVTDVIRVSLLLPQP